MQDLEKRISAIEKKLNMGEAYLLVGNEKIVWDFLLEHLEMLLEIRKNGDYYTLGGTGYRASIMEKGLRWATEVDKNVLEALIGLGLNVWEMKEKEKEENGKN